MKRVGMAVLVAGPLISTGTDRGRKVDFEAGRAKVAAASAQKSFRLPSTSV